MRKNSRWALPAVLTGLLGHAACQAVPAAPELHGTAAAESALHDASPDQAIARYRALVAAHPTSAEALTALGVLLYGSGHASEAADILRKALAIDPQAPRADLFLALSRAELRDCADAYPTLKKDFQVEPAGKLQRLIGLTLMACSLPGADPLNPAEIAATLQKNYPGDPDVLYQSAELYTRMWTQTAAELINKHPESYRVHQLAAEVFEAQGNLGQAIREYRAALNQNSHLPQMHYRIGQLLLRSGGADADEQAMNEFRAELLNDAQNAPSALAMGEIDRHLGRMTEAKENYLLALKLEPGLSEAQVGLAQTLIADHQYGAAEDQLKALLTKQPDDAQAHYAMMLALRSEGKLEQAGTEMAVFQRLQHGKAEQFQSKLDALLSGHSNGSNSPAAPSTKQ